MAGDPSGIQWREWSDETFEQAEKEDKLILLNISASWCHWCHLMDRATYADPEVIRIVGERFIPIKVDADRRPDIQDRYLLGGWPTTAFLVPDGRIVTGTTFIPPEAMIQKLKEVDALYREHKEVVTMHVTSMAAQAEADRAQVEIPAGGLDERAVKAVERTLTQSFDSVHGGFGTGPKFPYPDAVRFAFLRYRKTGSRSMLKIALKTLDGMMGIYDPVWGGFYRYSVDAAWSRPHYEKLLYVQAGTMDNYLEAYQVTGDDRYGEVAAGIKAYVARFLSDEAAGGFYGSQGPDVCGTPGAELVLGEQYFPKSESERLAIGIPEVDRTVYADANGIMASAYFHMYHAVGDGHARDFALKTVDRLLAENMCGSSMCHYFDGQPQLPGILADQVYFAQALVDAYQSIGDRRYLASAEKLVSFIVAHLQDVVDGGFYLDVYDPHAKGELSERHKPFDENVAVVRLLVQLHYLTGYQTYRQLAERALRGIAYPTVTESLTGAGFGLALDLFTSHPVQVVVVGDRDSEQTRQMLETGLHAYEPCKLVQVLDPEEGPLTIGDLTYEAAEGPVAYVCIRNVCRPPVRGTDDLVAVLQDVMRGAQSRTG